MSEARKVATGFDKRGNAVVEILAAHNALSEGSDIVSQSLYLLSETIIRGLLPDERGGGLGGEFGYGVNFENDVFMMHRYCWCERDDCKWCSGDEPNFRHKRTGQEIKWYKWIGRGMEAKPESIKDWSEIWTECWESIPAEARDKAKAEHEYEETPEYKAKAEEGMRLMMAAMDRMFSEMQPCYRCSMDEGSIFAKGGETTTVDGLKIVKVLLKDDGACPNCGHVTSDEEMKTLDERQAVMDAKMRERFAPR